MKAFKIKIIRFISNDVPGFVECKFSDAWKKEHTIQEKVPVVTQNDLDEDSNYPQDGFVACELVKDWIDQAGRKIFTVTTERPWAIETVGGMTEFDITEDQLINLRQ